MPLHFETIGIIGKYAAPTVSGPLRALVNFLRSKDFDLLLDRDTATVWSDHGLDVVDREEMGRRCDLVIVVGGDGTFLNAARTLGGDHDMALIGLNLGRLGFLTDISPDQMESKLERILSGEYLEEDRYMLHASVIRNGEIIHEHIAFNDVVVHKQDVARMIEIDTYVDATFITNIRADGMIVSTPTGSTAYALSGGGPIMEPELNAMLLVPICPPSMNNRPIVIDADTVVELVIKGDGNTPVQVSCDGQQNQKLVCGDRLIIRKYEHMIRMIHPADHNHFHILRAKLGWG